MPVRVGQEIQKVPPVPGFTRGLTVNLIRDAWQSYDRDVVPREAGESQRLETRRAFYAGAMTVLLITTKLGEDAVSEADGVKTLDAIHREMEQFRAGIGRGY
jgi:hypothetical protein